ncbi:MAG: efflux RND transporter permease subunit [bacterium]
MNISKFFETHKKGIIFLSVVLSAIGIILLNTMPVAIFPEITFPRLVILADNGDMPIEKMMIEVTKPIEEAVYSVPGVTDVRSATSRGSMQIFVNFVWGTDMFKALQLTQNAINQIRSKLPQTATITVNWMRPSQFPIIGLSLTSSTLNMVQLRDIGYYTLRPILGRLKGVSQVVVQGGKIKEYHVVVNPQRLAAYHLSLDDVINGLKKTNIISSAGYINKNYELYMVQPTSLFTSTTAMENTLVANRNGVPIYVRDIAKVETSVEKQYIRITSNGHNAVLLNILRQPGANTLEINKELKRKLEELKPQLPPSLYISTWYNQSDLIEESYGSVRDAIIFGVFIAILIMFLFLRNTRIMFITAITLPVTLIITVVLMKLFGQTLNLMTLGGMAASIGLIIDDSIVVLENIIRHFHAHGIKKKAVETGVKEILPAIIGSSLSTIVVFFPLAFLGGVAGAFFKALALTMASALTVSMIISITLTPVLAMIFLKDTEKEAKEGMFLTAVIKKYQDAMNRIMRKPLYVLLAIIILIGGSWLIYKHMRTGFMPEMDEGAFVMDYFTPPGTTLEETNRILKKIEKIILSIKEVKSFSRRTGTQLGFYITEPNTGDFLIRLKNHRNKSINQVIDELRKKIYEAEPGKVYVDFGQIMQDLIGDMTGSPMPIDIKIFSDNTDVLDTLANRIANLISNIKGVVDVFNGITISGPAINVHVDPLKAGLVGVTPEYVSDYVTTALWGTVATNVREGEKVINVRVIMPASETDTLKKLEALQIVTPSGLIVPLRSIARIHIVGGQAEIDRENLRRMLAVTGRISGRDLGSVMSDVKAELAKKITLPPGTTISYGGVYRNQQESFKGLLMVLLMAVALVFTVMILEFESLAVPLIIYSVILPSFFGVLGLLYITKTPLNISSLMGTVMIVGIVAENGIFVVHYIKDAVKTGIPLKDAVIKAGSLRIRPILMTALAAILALMPLALGLGTGAQMHKPLAIAIIGGFLLSVFLLIIVLPVVYYLFMRKGKKE